MAGSAERAGSSVVAADPVDVDLMTDASDHPRGLGEIRATDTLRVAVFPDNYPFCHVDGTGNYYGFDVLFAQQFGDELGVYLEYVAADAKDRIPYLESNKVDLVLGELSVTGDRGQTVDFTQPYLQAKLGILSRQDTPLLGQEDLAGARVAVLAGGLGGPFLAREFPEAQTMPYESRTDALNALLDGRCEGYCVNEAEAWALARSEEDLVAGIVDLGGTRSMAIAVNKGNNELLDWLNLQIGALKGRGFFADAYRFTLADALGPDYDFSRLLLPDEYAPGWDPQQD